MRLVIIGAGLSGHIAAGAFASYNPIVLESSKLEDAGIRRHYAVLRFESPAVAAYLGAEAIPIMVNKTIYHNYRFYNWCSPDLLNQYSMKVHNRLGRRSILNLGDFQRFLLNGFQPSQNVLYDKQVLGINKQVIRCKDGTQYPYDFCISTIPLYVMSATLLGMNIEKHVFHSHAIEVVTGELEIKSDIHQTVYFPDPSFQPYRATIEGSNVMIESADSGSTDPDVADRVMNIMGIPSRYVRNIEVRHQVFGKIYCDDDDYRRAIILNMTEQHNIYSFGRFAIWKQIRADHMLKDIEKIRQMITATEVGRKYHLKLGAL